MTVILAWLDYSERDRKRALDVVGLLREPSTVDELGLGPVRDGMSRWAATSAATASCTTAASAVMCSPSRTRFRTSCRR